MILYFAQAYVNMEFTFSFPVPGSKGCDQSLQGGNRMQLTCPNTDSSHRGFISHSLFDVGDANALLLAGYNTLGHRHLIGCQRQENGHYTCSASLLTESASGDPDSFNPRAHVALQDCEAGATLGTVVCSASTCNGIGQSGRRHSEQDV